MASLAHEEAVHHFEGALRAARQSGDQTQISELLIILGEAQRCAGDPAHRETLLEAGRLAVAGGDSDRAARAALANQRGVFSRMGAVDGERVAALEAALAAVGSAITPVRAQLLASMATELHFEGEERRLALAEEALEVARRVDDPATLAQVLAALWLAAWGSTAQAIQGSLAAELSELAGRLGDPALDFHAKVTVFYSATGQGDLERANEALSACSRIAGQLGQPFLAWRVTHLQMHRAMASGYLNEVEHWAAEALRLSQAAGQPDSLPYSRGALALTRILQGRAGEVEELLAPVIEQFPGAVAYPSIQAWAFAEAGRAEEARAILTHLRAPGAFAGLPRDHHRPVTLCLLSRSCYRLDDSTMAEELHDLLIPFRSQIVNGQTTWIGPATQDLGLLATVLGRYDEAEEHFADAVERQDRIGARGTVVHSRLEWARMLLRRGRPDDTLCARTLLQEAKTGAREVGIPIIESRIDQLLAQIPE
jgi:tetratricopeptide (TPR) repeat protein